MDEFEITCWDSIQQKIVNEMLFPTGKPGFFTQKANELVGLYLIGPAHGKYPIDLQGFWPFVTQEEGYDIYDPLGDGPVCLAAYKYILELNSMRNIGRGQNSGEQSNEI